VLNVVAATCAHQGQNLRACIGHVCSGVEPILEKEKETKDETGSLALGEEINCQRERDSPLQDGAAPESESRAKPAKQ
jgi:hypothetical protein